ncbi:hypothetical protein FRC10_009323 [Ceratobasidium sp. 414]|nr:hypothetical protein FRC10_009323 [Ceratobasidium sp. 414]
MALRLDRALSGVNQVKINSGYSSLLFVTRRTSSDGLHDRASTLLLKVDHPKPRSLKQVLCSIDTLVEVQMNFYSYGRYPHYLDGLTRLEVRAESAAPYRCRTSSSQLSGTLISRPLSVSYFISFISTRFPDDLPVSYLLFISPVPSPVSPILHVVWTTIQGELRSTLELSPEAAFSVTKIGQIRKDSAKKNVFLRPQHLIEMMEEDQRPPLCHVTIAHGQMKSFEDPFRMANLPVQPGLVDALPYATLTDTFDSLRAYTRKTPDAPLRLDEYAVVLPCAIVQAIYTDL